MAVTVNRIRPGPPVSRLGQKPAPSGSRRPLRDNPRLILAGIVLLIAVLTALLTLADRSSRLAPDFLSEFVLYALSVADLTILVALVFVLARNIVKMIVERRRALPFARFRAKLVAALLGMTLIPTVLVLLVGSELIRNSVERWFNPPIGEILQSANEIAGDYYQYRQRAVAQRAEMTAAAVGALDFRAADLTAVYTIVSREVTEQRVSLVDVYRVVPGPPGTRPGVTPVADVADAGLPPGYTRAAADRLAERVAAGSMESAPVREPMKNGAEMVRAAAPIKGKDGLVVGVIVTGDYLNGDLAARARRMSDKYAEYKQLLVLRQPLIGVYLSFFLMVTLMILVGATWTGLYMAKRITRPVQLLAAAAREIGAGHLDHRLEAETADEFGALVEAFNTMAAELAVNRRKLERSAVDLERKNQEVEGRRRYIETVLERIATGVVSVDATGRINTVNSAAARLLGLDPAARGELATTVFEHIELQTLGTLLSRAVSGSAELPAQEIAMVRDGRDIHLAAVATALHPEGGAPEGAVLVFDDITPLIRAQKVAAWRDVARRLAHEIKNPLTPIQLSAERMRRHFSSAGSPTRELVEECTTAIVSEVESLKALVDEFSQFARMPPPRRVPTDLHGLLASTLALYNGLFREVEIHCALAPALEPIQLDPEQIRRVVINLVDNAIEAMERKGRVTIETQQDLTNGVARIIIADNGPGIPPAEREKLFLPYYSTKQRGSGLGLAIVRRIVAEHGGSIEVRDNVPCGTRFVIDLPF